MNVNATRKWLIAFMLCVFIVRDKTLKQPLSSLSSSSPMKKKKTIQTTKKKTNNNYNNTERRQQKPEVTWIFRALKRTRSKPRKRFERGVRVNALGLGETSYASNMIASNVTWFDGNT